MADDDSSRFTTHKDRADWFQQRTSYPKRESYPSDLGRKQPSAPVWEEIGPHNFGGRLTSLAVDPKNLDRMIVGSAAGGVWLSENAGQQWTQAWDDHAPTLNIGSVAIHPANSNIFYAGSGEANLSGDNYPGAGLFRSEDSGKTWSLAGSSDSRLVTREGLNFLQVGVPRRIGTIAIDPFDPDQHILLGGVTHGDEQVAGLFETRDGGKSWNQASDAHGVLLFDGTEKRVFISPLDYFCHTVVFHPDVQGLVFATIEARGAQSGIWMSFDAGQSWSQAKTGLPSGDQFGRTSLAIARGSKTMYALAGQQGTQTLLGVFRSDNLGHTWTACARGAFANDGQLAYTNAIAMDVGNPKIAVIGSLELYKTADAGATWHQIGDGKALDFEPKYVHRDHHALAIHGRRICSANDGGFAVSENGGETWQQRNTGLSASMFYNVAVAPTDSNCIAGGTQDKGTWLRGAMDESLPNADFRQVLEADGGWVCYDPDNASRLYASEQRLALWRHPAGGDWEALTLAAIPPAEHRTVWMAVVAMDTGDLKPEPGKFRAVYLGSNRVWRSLDGGDSWTAISDPFDGSIISAIEVAHADPRFIYIGTTDGGLFRSMDSGATWTRNLAGPLSPGRIVTSIATAQEDPEFLLYTVGVPAEMYFPQDACTRPSDRLLRLGLVLQRSDDKQAFVAFRHVYQSRDAGDTWDDADGGSLPNLPHNAVISIDAPLEATARETSAVQVEPILSEKQPAPPPGSYARLAPAISLASLSARPAAPTRTAYFVAHDGGVGLSRDLKSWTDVTGNLPNVRITYLACHERDRLLVASTYGRGLWKISLDAIER